MTTPARTIAQQINRRAAQRNVPLSVLIEVTRRCNQRCYYCYQQGNRRSRELSLDEWNRVFGELADAGTLYLTISGGEPFVRRDILDIIAAARRRDFAVSVITNGTLITPAIAWRLGDVGVMDAGVSFLAANPRLHDRLSGVRGSFDRALKTVRLLKSSGVNVLLKHSVSARNFGEFAGLRRLADEQGCLFEADSMVVPHQQGQVSPFALDADQHRTFLRSMGATSPRNCQFDKRSTENLHCDAGRSLCGISPNGDVYPCIQLPLVMGNLRRSPFARTWRGARLRHFREQERHLRHECLTCRVRHACARCHGIAWYETGDWRGRSPSLCARARACAKAASTCHSSLLTRRGTR